MESRVFRNVMQNIRNRSICFIQQNSHLIENSLSSFNVKSCIFLGLNTPNCSYTTATLESKAKLLIFLCKAYRTVSTEAKIGLYVSRVSSIPESKFIKMDILTKAWNRNKWTNLSIHNMCVDVWKCHYTFYYICLI